MDDHPLIFNSGKMTCLENLFWGPARIEIFPVREVTFQRLAEAVKPKALTLGFSPPIHLPSRMPVDDNSYISDWWILDGELIEPIIRIRSEHGRDFFRYQRTEIDDQEVIASMFKMAKEHGLYSDDPNAKILQIWQERNGSIISTVQIDTETIHLWELIDETSYRWLFIHEDELFLASELEVRIIYEVPNLL